MKRSRAGTTLAILVIAVALLGAGVYWRLRGDSEDAEGGAEEQSDALRPLVSAMQTFSSEIANPVTGAKVIRDTLIMSVSAGGHASSFQSAVIYARVAGPVREIRVRENDVVSAGDVVLDIDPTDLEIQLERARINLRQAEARFREMTIADDRIADEAVRLERERAFRASSGLESAELELKVAERNLADAEVRAPFAGRVANVRVVPGQMLRAGDELLTIVSTDPIRFDANVMDQFVPHIRPGGRARLEFSAFPGEVFVGRVVSINPIVGEYSMARVTVEVPNPDGRILPGMYADARLDGERYPDRILVPISAVIERDRSPVVFVYENGLAMWRYVRTGLRNDEYVEILYFPGEERSDPLEPGEIVLTSGHNTLTHQAPVRLVEDVRAEGGRPQ